MADIDTLLAVNGSSPEETIELIARGQLDKVVPPDVLIAGLPIEVTSEYFHQTVKGLEAIYGVREFLGTNETVRSMYAARIVSMHSDKPVMIKAFFLRGMTSLRELHMILVDVGVDDVSIINGLTSLKKAYFQVHRINREEDVIPPEYASSYGWGDLREADEKTMESRWDYFIERRDPYVDKTVPERILDGYITNGHSIKDVDYSFIFTNETFFILRDGVAFSCNSSNRKSNPTAGYILMFYLAGIGDTFRYGVGKAYGTGKTLEYRMRHLDEWKLNRIKITNRVQYEKFNQFKDVNVPISVANGVMYDQEVNVLPVTLLNAILNVSAPLTDSSRPPSVTNTNIDAEEYLRIIAKYKYVEYRAEHLLSHLFASQENGINVFISEDGLKLVYLKVPPSLVDDVSEYIDTLGRLRELYQLKGPDMQGYYYFRSGLEKHGTGVHGLFNWLTAGGRLPVRRMIFHIDLPKWPLTPKEAATVSVKDQRIKDIETILGEEGGYSFASNIPTRIGERFYRADGTYYTIKKLDTSFPIIEKVITRSHRDGMSPSRFPMKEGFTPGSPVGSPVSSPVSTPVSTPGSPVGSPSSGAVMSYDDAIIEMQKLYMIAEEGSGLVDELDGMAKYIAANEPERAWRMVKSLYPDETDLARGVRRVMDELN